VQQGCEGWHKRLQERLRRDRSDGGRVYVLQDFVGGETIGGLAISEKEFPGLSLTALRTFFRSWSQSVAWRAGAYTFVEVEPKAAL